MSKKDIFLDSFSGSLVDIPKSGRTQKAALAVLRKDPRVSTWDMTERWNKNKEVWELLKSLENRGLIESVPCEFPWHEYRVNE